MIKYRTSGYRHSRSGRTVFSAVVENIDYIWVCGHGHNNRDQARRCAIEYARTLLLKETDPNE